MKKKILSTLLILTTMACPVVANPGELSEPSALETAVQQEVQISFAAGSLRVVGGAGQTVEVFNLTGVRVFAKHIDSGDQVFQPNLGRGCYIVKVGKTVRKINVL